MGKDRHGANGKPVVLKVPVGTQVFDEDRETLIHDFTTLGEKFTLAEGGNGGFGNPPFKSSTHPAPPHAHPRHEGGERLVWTPPQLAFHDTPGGPPQSWNTTLPSAVYAGQPQITHYPF